MYKIDADKMHHCTCTVKT